jgi:hypothetical protein
MKTAGGSVSTKLDSYSTSFPATENPISEGGVWTNGDVVGLDWTDVQTSGGLAHRTQIPGTPPPFDDSIACLSGFPANHYAMAVLSNSAPSGELEVELLLRWAISANVARGYEITIIDNGNMYLVDWGGAVNNFAIIDGPITTNVSTADGAIWYAQVVGNTVTVKCNGTTVLTRDVEAWATANSRTYWSTGNPGLGFYTDNSLGAPSAGTTYAWSSFEAGGL